MGFEWFEERTKLFFVFSSFSVIRPQVQKSPIQFVNVKNKQRAKNIEHTTVKHGQNILQKLLISILASGKDEVELMPILLEKLIKNKPILMETKRYKI